jgi:hypothetical protein
MVDGSLCSLFEQAMILVIWSRQRGSSLSACSIFDGPNACTTKKEVIAHHWNGEHEPSGGRSGSRLTDGPACGEAVVYAGSG